LYQHVAELQARLGSARALLEACEARMRMLRKLPHTRAELMDGSLDSILAEDDALGRIYQSINAPALEEAYRKARRDRRKFTARQVQAVTQLFTPRWVVEFLLHNTLGRLWKRLHPDSNAPLAWMNPSAPNQPETIPTFCRMLECRDRMQLSAIRVLDPACGTMNFGLVAVELLDAMYREEMDRAGRPGWPSEPSVPAIDQIPMAIVRHNLAGIDIDSLALRLAAATLAIKLRIDLPAGELNLHCADALFDAQMHHRFAGACDVVVTNPPYLSARNLPPQQVMRMKRTYPASWRDAGACFLERSIQFCRAGGRAGILTMQSFLFTGSFQKLREKLCAQAAIESIAHFGGGLFDVGNPGTLQTAALVLRREPDATQRASQQVIAYRLTGQSDKREALSRRHACHRLTQDQLAASPHTGLTYWLDAPVRRVFATLPRLSEVAPPRQGLATTDNARFVRFWWEVEPTASDVSCRAIDARWFAYTKSGRFRRWYEAPRHRVDWEDDGRRIKQSIVERYPYLCGKWSWVAKNSQFYGHPGVTYSYLTSGQFSARRLEAGTIFDVAGSALFPDDPLTMLGVLNSSVAARLLEAINPTVNFQVGDLAQLPVPRHGSDEIRELVARAIELQHQLDTYDETSTDFVAPIPWEHAEQICRELHGQLAQIEQRIDRRVCELYELSSIEQPVPATLPVTDRSELARRWVSFALWRALGRWGGRRTIVTPLLDPAAPGIIDAIRASLVEAVGDAAAQIESRVDGLPAFVGRGLFAWHVRLYNRRPILWKFSHGARSLLVAHDRADRAALRLLFAELHAKVPDRWDRCIDDGIAVNLAPLREWIDDASMSGFLEQISAEMQAGRYAWSQTHAEISRASTRGCASVRHQRPRATARCRDVRPART
jgi:hypothetical protein